MPYLRLSLMQPLSAHLEEAVEINRELADINRKQEGCSLSYFLSGGERGVVGRLSVWESESEAERMANDEHVMALRSRLLLVVEAPIEEHSFRCE